MKTAFLLFFVFFSAALNAHTVRISKSISDTSTMPFISRDSALALNVKYDDIKKLRNEMSQYIKKPLKFLQSWDPNGEAHVTTITPPEFNDRLKKYVGQEKMDQIAQKMLIQESDLKILGIGSGTKNFQGEIGETFFVIVSSENLKNIRKAIYKEYLKAGGPKEGFDPKNFYPHITIGYTHQDIHESDGLQKDVEHSLDKRFNLILE